MKLLANQYCLTVYGCCKTTSLFIVTNYIMYSHIFRLYTRFTTSFLSELRKSVLPRVDTIYKRPRTEPLNGGEGWMVSVLACRRSPVRGGGGKVCPEADTAEDSPERRVMMMSVNEHNMLIRLITSSKLASYRFAITTGYR